MNEPLEKRLRKHEAFSAAKLFLNGKGPMGVSLSHEDLIRLTSRWIPADRIPARFSIHTDTTDFFRVDYNDIVVLGGKSFLIRRNAKEGRFGLDDEEKFWVKRAIDLSTGAPKILKLVFYERFTTRVGEIEFECFRSPRKEARILELAAGRKEFMQGYSIEDETGNLIRVLEFISGTPLHDHIQRIEGDHETYFSARFPDILSRFIGCIEAIRYLHLNGQKHGDIRRDHILVEHDSGEYRWIDFDYSYHHRENMFGYDLFGLGNILLFLAGKGDVLLTDLKAENNPALPLLSESDLNIVFRNRVANLKKIYPYIPDPLNTVLLHFSRGANWFYEHTGQLLQDLEACRML